jgi:tetratricopeptide (TPR) repeat protein
MQQKQSIAKYAKRIILAIISIMIIAGPASSSDDSSDLSYSRAMLLKNNGEYQKAVDILKDLTTDGTQLDRIYFQIASCYSGMADYQEAIAFARKSIEVNPKFTEPYQLVYEIYMTLKNTDEAIEILSELLDENPDLIQAWYTLGIVYTQNTQNNVLAIDCFKKVIEITKGSSTPVFYREQSSLVLCEIFFGMKEYDKAISYLEDAIAINPRNSARYYRFTTNLLSAEQFNTARICMENFIRTNPEARKKVPYIKDFYAFLGNIYYITDNPQTNYYLRLGAGKDSIDQYTAQQLFLLSTGHVKEAEDVLVKITKEYPKYTTPYLALARMRLKRGEIDSAYESFIQAGITLYKSDMDSAVSNCFLEAHKLKPEEPDPLFTLGQVYERMKDYNLAIMYYSKYQEKKPDIEMLIHLAYLNSMIGNAERTEYFFSRAIAENPEYARIYFVKGVLANKDRKYADAENLIAKAIGFKQDDHMYYYQLAVAQEHQKKKDDAIAALKKALELEGKNSSYKNFLGYIYADLGVNIEEANRLITDALREEPYNGAYLDSLGWVYYHQGKYDLALRKLHQARRTLGAEEMLDPVVLDHIGDTYFKLGNHLKAVEYWKQAISLTKEGDDIDTNILGKKINDAGKE